MDYFLSRFNSFTLDTQGLTLENVLEQSKTHVNLIPESEVLVVCLPYWNQQLWTWSKVENFLNNKKYSSICYQFPYPILSNSAELTRECLEIISNKIKADITNLRERHGFKKVILITVSLSTSYGSLVYKDNPDIANIILIVPGENLARDMWNGCRTQHLRKSYEAQNTRLPELERLWHSLAPENNLPAENTKVQIFYGVKDRVIPIELGQTLGDVYMKNSRQVSSQFLPGGHYQNSLRFLLYPEKFLQNL